MRRTIVARALILSCFILCESCCMGKALLLWGSYFHCLQSSSLSGPRIILNSSAVQSNSPRTDDKTAPDTYPVLLNITYIDDLKNMHQIVLNNPIVIRPQQPAESPFQGGELYVILIGAAAAVGFTMILIRGRLKFNRKDNLVSKEILEGIDHNGKKGIEDSNTLIHSPRTLDGKKAGAPISTT
jgi:hypothetical protein